MLPRMISGTAQTELYSNLAFPTEHFLLTSFFMETKEGGVDFQIMDITYNAGDAPTVDLTFNSSEGQTFIIRRSQNLQEFKELEDGYPSEGDTTTFTDPECYRASVTIRSSASNLMGTKLHGRKRREMGAQEVTRFCELATPREGPYRAPHAGRRQAFNGCRNRLNTGRVSKIRLAIYLRPISR